MPDAHLTPDDVRRLLDQELAADEGRRLTDHLSTCPECKRTLSDTLSKLPAADPPPPGEAEFQRFLAGLRLDPDAGGAVTDDPRQAPPEVVAPSSAPLPAIVGYDVESQVGRGGMGVVYRVVNTELARTEALKVLRGRVTEERVQQFRQEVRTLARMQHPNIIRFYDAGATLGEPYFTMEYVAGGNLAERVVTSPPSLRLAVRLVEVIARAVGDAHRLGFVHNDLKPANVLLAHGDPETGIRWEPGEEYVRPIATDFGLARGSSSPGGGGTPAYMSPEQTNGEKTTPATDVWAIGVMLYELVTGRRPFTGDTKNLFAGIRKGDYPPPTRVGKPIPADLAAVIGKCLQPDPTERYYTTAGELADDLRRFQDNYPVAAAAANWPKRAGLWCLRHKLGTALAAVVAVSVVGLSILLAFAVIARNEADQSAKLARNEWQRAEGEAAKARSGQAKLLDLSGALIFELHDLAERELGGTAVQKAIVERALGQLREIEQDSGDDPEVLHALVVAFCKLGDVQGNPGHANMNDPVGSLKSYRTALVLAEKAVAHTPDNPVARRDEMICHNKIGEVLEVSGHPADAEAEFRRALALLDESERRGNAKSAADRVVALHRIGGVQLHRGGTVEAIGTFTDALALSRQREEIDSRSVAIALEHLAFAEKQAGRTTDADAHFRESLGILGRLARKSGDRTALRDWMVSLNKVADLEAATAPHEAGQKYREAQAVARRLANDKNDTHAQADLALSHERVGDWLTGQQKSAEALTEFTAARDIRRAVAATAPANHRHRADQANACQRVGDALLAAGRTGDALIAYGEELVAAKSASEASPGSPKYLKLLAVADKKVGYGYVRDNKPSYALPYYERACDTRFSLVRQDPAHVEYGRKLAVSLQDLGDAYARLNQPNEAGCFYFRALTLATDLHATTDDWLVCHTLYVAYERVGNWYQSAGHLDLALDAHRMGQQCLSARITDKSSPEDRRELANSHEKIGRILRNLNRLKAATEEFQKRVSVLRPMAADPNNVIARRDLGVALQDLGDVFHADRRDVDALKLYDESADLLSDIARQSPLGAIRPWRELCVTLERLGDFFATSGDADAAGCYCRRVLAIRSVLVDKRPDDSEIAREHATAVYGCGFVYSVLANHPKRKQEREALLVTARDYFVEARSAYQQLDGRGLLASKERSMPGHLSAEIKRCETEIALLKK